MEIAPEVALKLRELPPDCFVGTNNIASFLLGYMTLKELKKLCFLSLIVRADGRWDVWK